MSLSSVGTCTYNGYTFSTMMETTGIQGIPHYDQSGRTIAYWTWTLTLRDRIFFKYPDDVETQMKTIRQQLLVPGQTLTYANKGFGDLTINTGTKSDVKYGPSPKAFAWRSLGRDQAAEFTWTVETNIPEGCSSPTYSFALMAVNYSVDYNIDRDGYSTRTLSGYLEIPVTRSGGGRSIIDNADAYFEQIIPAVPPGFRPVDSRRRLSEDKRRLDFSFVHEEMPLMPLPSLVTEVDASHSISNQPGHLNFWTGTIRGTYMMSRDVPKNKAFLAFMTMAFNRIQQTLNNSQAGSVIPVQFTAEEDIYGKNSASFSLSYTFVSKIQNALDVAKAITYGVQAAGLWTPVPNSDWDLWRSSLSTTVFASRGYAGLRFNNSEDAIIDLCASKAVTLQPEGGSGPIGGFTDQLSAAFPPPPSDTSWLRYACTLTIDADASVINTKTLPDTNLQATNLSSTSLNDLLTSTSGPKVPDITGQLTSSYADTIQQQSTPETIVWLEGYAARAGYPILAPTLVSVGGIDVIPAGGQFRQGVVGNFGVPIVAAAWRLKFILPQAPNDDMEIPANPVARTDIIT